MSIRSIVIAGAALGLVVTGGVALAQDDSSDIVVTGRALSGDRQINSEVVRFEDLDISNYSGARTLLSRIDSAAKTVCAPQAEAVNLGDNADYRDCMYDAVSRAVSDVDAPTLTDLYQRW